MCSACAPYIYCVFFALAGSSVNFAAVYESQFAGPMLLVVLRAAAILVGTLFAALLERRRPSRGRHYSWLNYITQAGVALSFAQEVLDEPSLPLSMRSYVYTLVVTTAPPLPPARARWPPRLLPLSQCAWVESGLHQPAGRATMLQDRTAPLRRGLHRPHRRRAPGLGRGAGAEASAPEALQRVHVSPRESAVSP